MAHRRRQEPHTLTVLTPLTNFLYIDHAARSPSRGLLLLLLAVRAHRESAGVPSKLSILSYMVWTNELGSADHPGALNHVRVDQLS